jgi:hypothetical protein
MNESDNKSWRIDVHHHVVPPRYADSSMPIKIPDTQSQLQSMDSWAHSNRHHLAYAARRFEKSASAARSGAHLQ